MKPHAPITFPAVDRAFVKALNALLPEGYHASTRTIPNAMRTPGTTYFVITLAGGGPADSSGVTLLAALNVVLEAESYEAAEEAAALFLFEIQRIGAPFYWVENSNLPINFTEDGDGLEKRLITVQAMVSAVI